MENVENNLKFGVSGPILTISVGHTLPLTVGWSTPYCLPFDTAVVLSGDDDGDVTNDVKPRNAPPLLLSLPWRRRFMRRRRRRAKAVTMETASRRPPATTSDTTKITLLREKRGVAATRELAGGVPNGSERLTMTFKMADCGLR